MNLEALIADNQMRQRDERFETQARHHAKPAPLHNKSAKSQSAPCFQPSDFTYDTDAGTCVCPAGTWVSIVRWACNVGLGDPSDLSRENRGAR